MIAKLIHLFLCISIVFGSGGYDHGTSAGKGNWDISLTWNPFNYFELGQSYATLGYGLTKRMDIHAYYSYTAQRQNYYGGLFYQFLDTKRLDLATAIGVRAYTDHSNKHLFLPQLLFTIKLNEKIGIGGSIVDINNQKLNDKIGTAMDVFLVYSIFKNKKYEVDFTLGVFKPVLWKPKNMDWYPTYSIDIKL